MNNTSLLERTLKAMTESRDDVLNAIGEIPTYKEDYDRRVAQATAQLAEHDACIKALEAAIAVQAKPSHTSKLYPDDGGVEIVYEGQSTLVPLTRHLKVYQSPVSALRSLRFDVCTGGIANITQGYLQKNSVNTVYACLRTLQDARAHAGMCYKTVSFEEPAPEEVVAYLKPLERFT